MRKIFTTRRRIVIASAAAAVVVVGGAGAAYAYFTASGTGVGTASVGTTGTWTVTQTNTSGGPLYPGSGTIVDTFTIQNSGHGDQKITSAVPSLASASGVAESGTSTSSLSPITGCQASWFTAAFDATTANPTGTQVSAGQSVTVEVDVTMPSDSTDNQNSCQSSNPAVLLTVG